jgi:hypothetical protein
MKVNCFCERCGYTTRQEPEKISKPCTACGGVGTVVVRVKTFEAGRRNIFNPQLVMNSLQKTLLTILIQWLASA